MMSGNLDQKKWIGYHDKDIHHLPFPYPWNMGIDDSEKFLHKGLESLKKNNIDTRPVFPPINQYPIWKNKNKTTKNADILSKSAINLPSGVNLSKEKIIYICKIINKFFIKNV